MIGAIFDLLVFIAWIVVSFFFIRMLVRTSRQTLSEGVPGWQVALGLMLIASALITTFFAVGSISWWVFVPLIFVIGSSLALGCVLVSPPSERHKQT